MVRSALLCRFLVLLAVHLTIRFLAHIVMTDQINGKNAGAFAVDQEDVLADYSELVVSHLVRSQGTVHRSTT